VRVKVLIIFVFSNVAGVRAQAILPRIINLDDFMNGVMRDVWQNMAFKKV